MEKLKTFFDDTMKIFLKTVSGKKLPEEALARTAFKAGFISSLVVYKVSEEDRKTFINQEVGDFFDIMDKENIDKFIDELLESRNTEVIHLNAEKNLPGQKCVAVIILNGDAEMIATQLNCLTDNEFAKAVDTDLILIDQFPEKIDVTYAFHIIDNLCESFQVMSVLPGTSMIHRSTGEEYRADENGFTKVYKGELQA